MQAASLSVTGGEQALPARNVWALPMVDSWLSQDLSDQVQDQWAVTRFNVDIYQKAAGLEVRHQALKDALEDLLRARPVGINGPVSDKMRALCDRLEQLQSDYDAARELQMRSDWGSGHLQHLSERTEPVCGGGRPALPEVVVSQAQSARLESTPELVWEIQPQDSGVVESEVVPHYRQGAGDQMADLESRIVTLEESSTEASVPPRDLKTVGFSDIKQMISEVSENCGKLGRDFDQHGSLQGSKREEFENRLTGLCHICDEMHEWVANAEASRRQEVRNLKEAHHRELESCRTSHQEEIADIQARYQGRVGSLQQELLSSHERIEKMNESIREGEARLQAAKDGPAVSDAEIIDLRAAVARRNDECALLKEQIKTQQLRYEALAASHQVEMDRTMSAHQRDLEQMKQEHQAQLSAQDQDVSQLKVELDRYKRLIIESNKVIASNEGTVADYSAQLMFVTASAERLASSLKSLDLKHREVQGELGAGREQLAEVVAMARGLADEMAEHKLAAELASGLEECSAQFANLKEDVEDVQREIEEARGILGKSPAPVVEVVETESSAADDSDVARTYASLNRREVDG